ncbi:glycosyltransferase family protein [Marinigracilibium pacificum]|uniref:Glycosyltransferase family 2 protein n=1 Tax=Marinigracilibium pacificum TaxID=2729599 RepID=A0A848J7D6_9BACT|nr:glycosyltransferase family 2 protein [Marinigracilibium pacificum]NMM50309.1 glycosyltransferase family 2 protein [Marinigracilibium pacificum]
MKVSGFTFIKNAVKYDYPIEEAIRSILPLCDEVVVAVGDCEDETRKLIENIDPKIRIVDTVWDPDLTAGGKVLAEETNKAFKEISPDTDWCFYIQGDEILHEKYIPAVREAMLKWKDNPKVDGLLFNYLHFYASYDYIGTSSNWYRREIRIIKNDSSIYSYRDAQGFRKNDNEKLRVKLIDAYIYHYGWVKDPKKMLAKIENFVKLYKGKEASEKRIVNEGFDYSTIDALAKFEGTHPKVMESRINRKNWKFEHDLSYSRLSFKEKIKRFVRKTTGYHLWEYRNYKLLK